MSRQYERKIRQMEIRGPRAEHEHLTQHRKFRVPLLWWKFRMLFPLWKPEVPHQLSQRK